MLLLLLWFFSILKGVLGESENVSAETKGLLLTHDIEENPYPNDIDQYFPPPFSVDEELKHRKDFRWFTSAHCCSILEINIKIKLYFATESIAFFQLIRPLLKIWTMHFPVYC